MAVLDNLTLPGFDRCDEPKDIKEVVEWVTYKWRKRFEDSGNDERSEKYKYGNYQIEIFDNVTTYTTERLFFGWQTIAVSYKSGVRTIWFVPNSIKSMSKKCIMPRDFKFEKK